MLFNDSVAECTGLPVIHWNFDENKVNRALHDIVDDAAFYIGATVNPQRRVLGGESHPANANCTNSASFKISQGL